MELFEKKGNHLGTDTRPSVITIAVGVQCSAGYWFSNLNLHGNHLEDLLTHRLLGHSSRASDLLHLGQS